MLEIVITIKSFMGGCNTNKDKQGMIIKRGSVDYVLPLDRPSGIHAWLGVG